MVEADKYSDFKIALRRFVEEACSILRETGVAVRRWVRIVHEEKGTSFPEEERTDYSGTSLLLIRKYHDNFIKDTLRHENMLTKKIFNKTKLEEIIDMFLNGDSSLLSFVMNLVSLEIYLKNIDEK